MTWWRSRWFKRALWVLLGVPFAFAALIIALQTFYALRPAPPLSEDAIRLQAIAAPYFTPNDAGYLALGLLAPEGMDPIAVGKCLAAEYAERARAEGSSNALESAEDAANRIGAEIAASEKRCGDGRAMLNVPSKKRAEQLTTTLIEEWSNENFLPAIIVERMSRLDTMGPSGYPWFGLGGTFSVVSSSTFLQYWQWLQARAASAFLKNDVQAFEALQNAHRRSVSRYGRGLLVEAMIVNVSVARNQKMLHYLATESGNLNLAKANALRAALDEASMLPGNVAIALAGEFVFQQRSIDQIQKLLINTIEWMSERLTFVPNDIANLSAAHLAHFERNALTAQQASKMHDTAPQVSTTVFGFDLGMIAYLVLPNPVGRVFAEIALPHYSRYALRAHDAIAHANAIRLVIAAREQGIHGDAIQLKALIENAPANMRNPYTDKPFDFDAASKTISFQGHSDGLFPGAKPEGNRIVVGL